MPQHAPKEPLRVAEINETRQMNALRELADEALEVADGVVCFTKGVAWINHATRVGFAADVSDKDLDTLESFLRDRGATPKIELTTFATEAFLASLAARGYVVEHFEDVLIRSLHPDESPFSLLTHPPPPGLEIVRTDPTDIDACRRHAILVMKGFMPEPIPEEQIQMGVRSMVHPRSTGFVATIDGEPAGACGMEIFEHAGQRIAALWGAAVSEPFRRRGVQQAMLARRMQHAIERGCSAAIIESKPGTATERNVSRLGFTVGYVRVCLSQRDGSPEEARSEPSPQ